MVVEEEKKSTVNGVVVTRERVSSFNVEATTEISGGT
jgi:hypothetical protein